MQRYGRRSKRIELYDVGGGSKVGRAGVITPLMEKVVIGIDDTDTKYEGATWTLANNIGMKLNEIGFEYLDHITVQLYPHNPNKTQNCVAIALVFAIKPGEKDMLVKKICELLKKYTLSDKTSIAVLEGIGIPVKLRSYAETAKRSMIRLDEAQRIANEVGVQLLEVTGARGEIGALAALGLYNDVNEAVKVYY